MTPTAQHGEIEGAFVTVSAVVVVAHSTQAGIVLDGGSSRIRMEVVGDGEAAEVPPGEIGVRHRGPAYEPDDSEDLSEEEIQRRKFAWEEGDVRTIYDPYAEEGRKRRQQPRG